MFNRVKRLLAAYIDFYICVFIAYFFAAIPILIIPNVSKTSVLPISIYLIAFFTSAICKDKLFKNQSIGKKILKMRVVKDNGKDLCAVDILKKRFNVNFITIRNIVYISR